MAIQLKDRILTLCNTVGTNDAIVGEPKEGYQGWEGITIGNTVYYCITDDAEWEVGYGNYMNRGSTQAISRTVLSSSNNDAKISLSGNSSIFCTYPAEKAVIKNTDGNLYLAGSNIQAKNIIGAKITADEVESPVVITTSLLVGDGALENEEGVIEMLKIYTKDEVDELQSVQDTQIEQNKHDIIELEEEIEALAPSFDRGQWDYKTPASPTDSPEEATYFTLDGSGAISTEFSNTAEILFHNTDVTDTVHTWSGVESGQFIEVFDSGDDEFLLAEINEVTLEVGYVKFAVTVKQSEGGPTGTPPDLDAEHRVRIKIFEIPEVDVSTLMPKAGGTFTGKVTHTKDIETKPASTNKFVNLKVFPPKDPDTDDWDFTSAFGVNVDLDHGNTLSNSFKFSNRYGDILTVNGGTGPGAKYEGRITDEKHLVNKEYVDSRAGGGGLITLASPGGGYKYVSSSSTPPSMGQFSANDNNTANNTNWHFYNMHDNNNLSVMCKDYEKTDTTMLEIWNQGSLRVRTTLKAWQPSSRSPTCMQAICSGGKPSTALGATLASNSYYDIIITNLRKK